MRVWGVGPPIFSLGTPEKGADGSKRPSYLSFGGAGGAKVLF